MISYGTDVTSTSDFPYYAFSMYNGTSMCGATLIHDDILLTSAQCQTMFTNGVNIGGIDILGSKAEQFHVLFTFPHPYYHSEYLENDIMLVKLDRASTAPKAVLNFDSTIPDTDDMSNIIGFGLLESSTGYPGRLQRGIVRVLNNDTCNNNNYYYYYGFNISNQFCSEHFGNSISAACFGDEGGPIINSAGVQIGIISRTGCRNQQYIYSYYDYYDTPIYTRVSAYKDFILQGICDFTSYPSWDCDSSTAMQPPFSSKSSPFADTSNPSVTKTSGTSISDTIFYAISIGIVVIFVIFVLIRMR